MLMPRQLVSLLVCLAVLLGVAGCSHLPKQPVTGVLEGDLHWSGEIRLAGDVILAENSRLVIAPGTRILFLPPADAPGGLVEHPHFPGSELIVKGRLQAIGRPDAPIVFRAADPQASAGSWGAVNLAGSPEAIFEYCIFRQADSAIHSRDSQVYIEQSLFENNLVGIRFHDSDILIEDNLLRDNDAAIRFHFGAPVICNNRFEANRVHLFVTSHPRDYRIEHNHFGPASDYRVVLGEAVPEDLLLPRNYWGLDEPAELLPTFFDGHRSDYLGKVRVAPMLTEPPRHNGFSWNP